MIYKLSVALIPLFHSGISDAFIIPIMTYRVVCRTVISADPWKTKNDDIVRTDNHYYARGALAGAIKMTRLKDATFGLDHNYDKTEWYLVQNNKRVHTLFVEILVDGNEEEWDMIPEAGDSPAHTEPASHVLNLGKEANKLIVDVSLGNGL